MIFQNLLTPIFLIVFRSFCHIIIVFLMTFNYHILQYTRCPNDQLNQWFSLLIKFHLIDEFTLILQFIYAKLLFRYLDMATYLWSWSLLWQTDMTITANLDNLQDSTQFMCLCFEDYGKYNANIQTTICNLRYFCPCTTWCQI